MASVATLPYNYARPVTPSDTVNLQPVGGRTLTDAINVGTAGTLSVLLENDQAVTFTAQAGDVLPVKVKRVNALGTSAGALVALYVI